ncbi:MAG: L-threonylcarbamoyladenylate synthase [Patescibacteria group bacterium]
MERVSLEGANVRDWTQLLIKSIGFLKAGGVVVAPTDTVYGILGDVFNQKTLEKVFLVKGRNFNNPLPIFVDSFEMLDRVAFVKNKEVEEFLKKSWPGKITCVLPSRGWMPLEVREGSSPLPSDRLNIAVRIPDHHFLLELIKRFGGPLTGTSANYSGRGPYAEIEKVISEFKHLPIKPDLIIDAGDLPQSKPSAIFDCTVWPPKILRE